MNSDGFLTNAAISHHTTPMMMRVAELVKRTFCTRWAGRCGARMAPINGIVLMRLLDETGPGHAQTSRTEGAGVVCPSCRTHHTGSYYLRVVRRRSEP